MIEPTEEMRKAIGKAACGQLNDDERDAVAAAVLALIERDYRLDPYCNAELMPNVVCKHPRTSSPRHQHEAKLPSTGNWVKWS